MTFIEALQSIGTDHALTPHVLIERTTSSDGEDRPDVALRVDENGQVTIEPGNALYLGDILDLDGWTVRAAP